MYPGSGSQGGKHNTDIVHFSLHLTPSREVTTSSSMAHGAEYMPAPTGAFTKTTLGLSASTQQDVGKYIQKHGVSGLENLLRNVLEEYRQTPVNIAVTGQSGAGKSSFINCARDMVDDDVGAAAVNVYETIREIQSYTDPNHPNIVYWDLPGIGTSWTPRNTYLDIVEFSKYDLFFILSSERIKEDDLHLAKSVHEREQTFYFIRTKIDSDIANDSHSRPSKHDPKKLIKQVRDDYETMLSITNLPTDKIFIISNLLENKAQYDFPKLMDAMMRDALEAKRLSLVLAFIACSENGIRAKKAELDKKIPDRAKLAYYKESAAGSRREFIIEECVFYKKEFGLDEKDVTTMGVDLKTLSQWTLNTIAATNNLRISLVRWVSGIWNKFLNLVYYVLGIEEQQLKKIEKQLRDVLNECAEVAIDILHRKLER